MAFLADYRRDLPDTLTNEDWDFLKNTHTFLQPFQQATLRGEKDSTTLDHALSMMDLLLHWFEKSKVCLFSIYYAITYAFQVTYADNPRMIHAIEMGWFVLSKYYGLSDATPAYAAAILLHPQKRA